MLLLPEMVFLLTRKLTSMRFNQKLFHLIKESKSLVDLYQVAFSKLKSVFRNSSLTLKITCQEVKLVISLNLKKLNLQLPLKLSNKDKWTKKKRAKTISWIASKWDHKPLCSKISKDSILTKMRIWKRDKLIMLQEIRREEQSFFCKDLWEEELLRTWCSKVKKRDSILFQN